MTGEAVELSVQPAALAARALSCLIDYIAYSLVNVGLLIAMFWLLLKTSALNGLLLGSVITVMTISVFVLLPMLIEVLTHGRSLGKFALGLRIVRDDGGAIHSSERCCGPSRSSRPEEGSRPCPVSSPRRRSASATIWPAPWR